MTNSFKNLNPSMSCRIHNSLVNGIRDQITLLKMLVIVPEDDSIQNFVSKNDPAHLPGVKFFIG